MFATDLTAMIQRQTRPDKLGHPKSQSKQVKSLEEEILETSKVLLQRAASRCADTVWKSTQLLVPSLRPITSD